MGSELENIPDDVPTLQALLVASLRREAQLRHLIDVLNRNKFGKKSEKLPVDQLRLGLEDQAIAMAEAETLARDGAAAGESLGAKRGRPRRDDERPRASLPPHLPRVEVVLDAQAQECPCCMGVLHKIGEDRSERLDIISGLVTVLRRSLERLKFATGDRRDDQAFRRVQAGGGAYCADQRAAA